MKHLTLVVLLLVLCGTLALAGQDRRKEKMTEERVVAAQKQFPLMQSPAGTLGWASFDIESATSRYKGIEILPGGVVWIVGNNNSGTPTTFYGYRSVNSGASWKKFTLTLPTGHAGVTNITAKDSNTALVGTDGGAILRTTDGGAKWDSVYSYADVYQVAFMDAVMFVGTTRDTVVAVGDADDAGLFVGRSTNAGATWTRLTDLPATDSVKSYRWYAAYYTYGQCMDVYQNTIWISLYYGSGWDPRMLISTNAGVSWSVYTNVLPGGNSYDTYLRSINFKDQNVGYAVIKGFSASSTSWMVKTTDGGKTWSDTINVQPGVSHADATPLTVKPIRGTNNVFAGGYGIAGAKAWWSTDNGATWTNLGVPTGPTVNATVYNAAFTDAQHGFAIGREINLMLTPPTAIGDETAGKPEGYTLRQNFPNPFNPSTTIEYALPSAGTVQLKVYDMLGREVVTLVNQEQVAGKYAVRFDAHALASGIYYYRLVSGTFVSTKSLVLMK
jgi:photosystem II stability/assembly factor-like uncharacterized protein